MLVPAGLVLLAGAGGAGAQTPNDEGIDERLQQCARIEDSARRIACYDELSGRGGSAPADDGPGAGAMDALSAPDADPVLTAPPAKAATMDTDAGAASEAPQAAPRDSARAEPAAQVAPAAGDNSGGAFEIRATIVESARSGINHFVVQLDNGQVWEETDGSRRIGLPRVGSTVTIFERRRGGYRMRIGDDNRIAWVRRLK